MVFHPGLYAAVFSAGLLSFFSPCILPLLPVYIGYFSADEQDGRSPLFRRIVRTLAFVAGVSTVFLSMGIGAGLIGAVFQNSLFLLFCGVMIVLMGLYQMGLFAIPFLERARTMVSPVAPGKGLLGAFALGFFFSFGWTPCIGPILTMVLGVSLEQGSAFTGGVLLLVYVLGFSIPFLLLAVGSQVLLKRIRGLYTYLGALKVAGGILIAAMGVWIIAGQIPTLAHQQEEQALASSNTLSGEAVSLSDWSGKTVYLKFWATWCPVCLSGMKEFDELAEQYADSEEIIVYSVVAPGYRNEMDRQTFEDWAKGQQLSFPILFDEDGALNRQFGIRGYPSSVFLDGEQNVAAVRIGHMHNDEIEQQLTELIKEKEASQ